MCACAPVTGHHWNVPGSICFAPSLQVFMCIDENPWAFSRLNSPSLPALSQRRAAPISSNHLCGTSLHSLQYPHLSSWGSGEPGPAQHSSCCTRGMITSLHLLAKIFPHAAQAGSHQPSLLQGHSDGSCQLFCQAAFQLGRPQHTLVPGVVPPQCRTWHFPLLNYTRFLSAHFSSLTKHWLLTIYTKEF